MGIATGIAKRLVMKKEVTYGVLPGATGAKTLNRTTSDFNLEKETYQSENISENYQISDLRHGVKSVSGSLNAEFVPGAYSDLFAAALAKSFVVGSTAAAVNLTVAQAGSLYTLTRTTGSYITDGIRVGDVIRVTVGTGLAADVLNKNLIVTSLTALVATVSVLNATVMTGSTSTSATIVVQGKKTFIPLTGHTSDSFTFEEFYSNLPISEVYVGNKVNTIDVTMPASGMSTLSFGIMGKDLGQTGTSAYFTTPTAASTAGILAGVNGLVVFNGTPVALITDASINISRNITNATVLGSNSIAEAFDGRCNVGGSFSLYFTDATARNAFKDETEVSLIFALTTGSSATADFVSLTMGRCKINSFTKSDSAEGITASCDFVALLPTSNGAVEQTTISVQDSLAV